MTTKGPTDCSAVGGSLNPDFFIGIGDGHRQAALDAATQRSTSGEQSLPRAKSKGATRNEKGFTLAESLMAVVVLGIAAAGVLLPFSSGAGVRAEGARRTMGVKLASDLMEQIVNTPFDQIVATYGAYSESQGQVTDTDGAVFIDGHYANFGRDATCQYVYVPQESGTEEPIFIRATVRVYYSGRTIATINRLISE